MICDDDTKLFSVGSRLNNRGGLDVALEQHECRVLKKIEAIFKIDELTDRFMEKLIRESLIVPIILQKDQIERINKLVPYGITTKGTKLATEVTICIPFTGDQQLFGLCPNNMNLNLPYGHIQNKELRFAAILERGDIKKEIESNLENIEWYLTRVNKQVEEFNLRLPAKVKKALVDKHAKLFEEAQTLDEIGIPERKSTNITNPIEKTTKTKLKNTAQFSANVINLYVQNLTQLNYNKGDVNNAIQ